MWISCLVSKAVERGKRVAFLFVGGGVSLALLRRFGALPGDSLSTKSAVQWEKPLAGSPEQPIWSPGLYLIMFGVP